MLNGKTEAIAKATSDGKLKSLREAPFAQMTICQKLSLFPELV